MRIHFRSLFFIVSISLLYSILYLTSKRKGKTLSRSFTDVLQYSGGRLTGHNSVTIVILYSNQRCGSSFLGELFNKNSDVFYMFEPLLPFTTKCKKLKKERMDLLEELAQCQFENIHKSYQNAFDVLKYTDYGTLCVNNTICFYQSHAPLLEKYAKLCNKDPHSAFNPTSSSCGYPLKTKTLGQVCSQSNIRVFKVLRLCTLQMLDDVYLALTNKGYNVYAVHLVRDPRASLASRLKMKLDDMTDSDLEEGAKTSCDGYSKDLAYIDQVKSGKRDAPSMITDGKYIRIRFEDIAMDSLDQASELYRFIGKKVPSSLKSWIDELRIDLGLLAKVVQERVFNIVSNEKVDERYKDSKKILNINSDPYATVRDPKEVLRKWMKTLTFEQIEKIQEICKTTMHELQYKFANSSEEMKNLAISYH